MSVIPWYRVFLEKLIFIQLVKKFPVVMEQSPQKPAIALFLEQIPSSSHLHNYFFDNHFNVPSFLKS